MKLRHELWEDSNGKEYTFCLAGKRGNGARNLLSPSAKMIWAVEAESHFEAMTKYYQFMNCGEYTTDQEWDKQPYPAEWSDD